MTDVRESEDTEICSRIQEKDWLTVKHANLRQAVLRPIREVHVKRANCMLSRIYTIYFGSYICQSDSSTAAKPFNQCSITRSETLWKAKSGASTFQPEPRIQARARRNNRFIPSGRHYELGNRSFSVRTFDIPREGLTPN